MWIWNSNVSIDFSNNNESLVFFIIVDIRCMMII